MKYMKPGEQTNEYSNLREKQKENLQLPHDNNYCWWPTHHIDTLSLTMSLCEVVLQNEEVFVYCQEIFLSTAGQGDVHVMASTFPSCCFSPEALTPRRQRPPPSWPLVA